MIAPWMLYSVLVGGCVGIAAVAGEYVFRAYGRAGRWVWVAALLATVGFPLFNITIPGAFQTSDVLPFVDVDALTVVGTILPGESGNARLTIFGAVWLERLLLFVWLAASLGLASLVSWTTWKLVRERRSWPSAFVGGESVLVSNDVGPAVVGIVEPAIVVPSWVLDLGDEERRLVVLHEAEHAKAGDLKLLFGGLLAVVLLPWNPVVWWIARRMRLAAEADCDARVVARGESKETYGSLLLDICSRARNPAIAVVALSERKSPLLRRIELLTADSRGKPVKVRLAVVAYAIALTLACEVPTPAVAPNEGMEASNVYWEFEVDEPPRLVERPSFEYPQELLDESAEGVVSIEAVVDVNGNIEPGSLRVIETTDERFNDAALQHVSKVRFEPGKVDDEPVRVRIRMPMQFSIIGGD